MNRFTIGQVLKVKKKVYTIRTVKKKWIVAIDDEGIARPFDKNELILLGFID